MRDQIFSPGDKVARALHEGPDHLEDGINDAPFGVVFCVELCFSSPWGDAVTFVGLEDAFLANNFRRVEEIQLCVSAAKHFKQPQKEVEHV